MKNIFFLVLIFSTTLAYCQFSGAAGTSASAAIAKDSSIIIAWATDCNVERGLINISDGNSGFATNGQASNAIGHADLSGIVSLGDSGAAILTFANSIFNGIGPDFAVFENSFSDSFLELAHVEVSSDGINFFRFPSDFLQNIPQIGPFDELSEPEKMNNLAGKYRMGFGTPFDLQELDGIVGLNINSITHIKIIDAIGSISAQYGSQDQNGNFINDPFPTPFPSSGFDLDAVGVIHQTGVNGLAETESSSILIYPNPANDFLFIKSSVQIEKIVLSNTLGKVIYSGKASEIDLFDYSSGVYVITVQLHNGTTVTKRILMN
ncbi:T9SS type A sorting domain-containing protein [Crocinitomicaceae bacterium]|jgi:hypothetical protein|nr:T9SS type A sorting domain-containing protein [Crocinitomicaceae bacterium]MDG1347955.1 T9SS type A sorting domain-containing protein [Crocinitomicaceae bacterium]